MHLSLDLEKYYAVLEFLGVTYANDPWYTKCAQGLWSSTDELVTADGIISLLEFIKNLRSSSLDDSLLRDFTKSIAKSKCLKTLDGYKTPEESILFDPAWESILNVKEVPTIDENFYGTEILVYKNQLRHIGVQVDPLSVCSLFFELTNQGQFCGETSIASIYTFLNKFHWCPEVPDETELKVYVHDHGWFDPQDCVLHDEKNMFRTSLCLLDRFYDEELLPLFSSAFGVAENPTINHYLELWETCDSSVNRQVINLKTLCCSFWEYVIANWNSEVAYLTNRTEVFLADDLQLKKILEI